jgi:CheY-like chemotaxis protein
MNQLPEPSPAAEALSDPPVLRILLVEDDVISQVVCRETLQAVGHRVALANSGRDVLAMLAREPFDVVLMDVYLREMDGLETTAAIRSEERGTPRHQPILAMTPRALRGDRERCLSAGMDGYLAKPLAPSDLLEAFTCIQPLVWSHRAVLIATQTECERFHLAHEDGLREDAK